MAYVTVEVDEDLLAWARKISGASSDKGAVELTLRRLVAPYRKREMIEGIASLTDLPAGLGAPTIEYPVERHVS